MTQPIAPNYQLAAHPVAGPDGKQWIALTIGEGLHQHTLVMDTHTAEQMIPAMTQVLQQAIDHTRPANAGLILPTSNGHHPPAPTIKAHPLHGL